jgi:hypothetical protein
MTAGETVYRQASNVTANTQVLLIALVLVGLLLIQEPMAVGG